MKQNFFLILIIIPFLSDAQSVLKLDEAISIALESNYGIQISLLEQKSDAMQVYKSNAGFGPTINWNTNFNMAKNDVKQKFIDETQVNRDGRSYNPSTNLTLGITLFDGGRMEATYERLGQLSEYSMLEGKIIIQNTILDVMATYYDIDRQKETVTYLETIIANYEERLKITEERWNVGRGSKLDYLQSKTDLNVQLSDMARAKANLKNAKVLLNGILNRDPNTEFAIELDNETTTTYDISDLIDQARNKNREMILLQKSLELSRTQEKIVNADRAPQVNLNGSIGFSYNNTNAGFILSNRSFAASAGFTARYNLVDGNHRKNQLAISKMNTSIIELEQKSLEQQIINDITYAHNQYLSDRELLEFEDLNKAIAEENLTISLEKFRLGGSSILELNEAQRAYDTALNRLVNAQFNIKLSELELLRLSGNLVE